MTSRLRLLVCLAAPIALAFACAGGSGAADTATPADGGTSPDTGVAPDTGTAPDAGQQEDAGVVSSGGVVFTLDAASRDLPVPFDFFTVADPTTPTGLRVQLGDNYSVPFSVGLNFLGAKYPRAIAQNDGWSTVAPIILTMLKRPDLAQFTRADDYTGADAPILLFAVPAPGAPIVREKILASYREDVLSDGRRVRSFTVRPRLPLVPKTKYAMVIRSALKTALGGPFEAPPDFAAVRDGTGTGPDFEKAAALISPVVDVLTGAGGLEKKDLSLITVFTTMSIVDDYETIDAMMTSGAIKAPVRSLDPDGDGTPDITVPSYPAEAGLQVEGSFNSPRFTDAHGVFVWDAAGKPSVQMDDTLRFTLLMPKTGTQPFRTCIFQHGLGGDRSAVMSLGRPLLDKGIAVIAIDAVTHGSRSPDPGGAALQFLNISEPATARDNFRQTVIDHMQLARFIATLNDLDVYPPDAQGKPKGDGTPDLATDDICYYGNSLGSIIGGSTMAVTKSIGAGILNVGGGLLMEFVQTFIGDKVPSLKDSPEIPLYSIAVQQILDKGDPVPIGRYVVNEPRPFVGRAKQILLQEAINDETVPNVTTEHLARAIGLPLLKPFSVDIWGLTQADAPAGKLGIFQFDPGNHNFIDDDSSTPIGKNGARARAQVAEFANSYFTTGTASIINPPSP